MKIAQTMKYEFSEVEGKRRFYCENHNAFLYMFASALTGKTGFTNQAGYCYIAAVREENRTFILVLLACGWPNNKHYKWEDAKKLSVYGLKNYQYVNVKKNRDS